MHPALVNWRFKKGPSHNEGPFLFIYGLSASAAARRLRLALLRRKAANEGAGNR